MRVLILGAAGMLGRKLATHLAAEGHLGGRAVTRLLLIDVVTTDAPKTAPFAVETRVSDVSERHQATALVDWRPDVIFHLAAIVSGEAEADCEKGYRINFDGTRHLFDAVRMVDDYRPRLVFTSSLAVFGAPLPDVIDDEHLTAPLTSYGTQKARVKRIWNTKEIETTKKIKTLPDVDGLFGSLQNLA